MTLRQTRIADRDEFQALRVGARYALLASAIAGRKVSVAIADGVTVHTDGHTVFIPAMDDATVRPGIVVQCALLSAGSLDVPVVRQLIGHEAVARRYLTLEAARALDLLGRSAPRSLVGLIRGCWTGPISGSAEKSLEWAFDVAVPEAPASFGTIRPGLLLGLDGRGASSRSKDSHIRRPPPSEPDRSDEPAEESRLLNLFSSPMVRESRRQRLLRRTLGAIRRTRPGEQGGGGDVPASAVQAAAARGQQAMLIPAPPGLGSDPGGGTDGVHTYPEWDYRRQDYRRNWCSVGEFDPRPRPAAMDWALRPDIDLRRQLGSIGLGYVRHSRQPDGDNLDVGALVEFAVTRVLGETPDDRVYQRRLRTARDLGVVVLLDASGSTADQLIGGVPIWDEQRRVAARLAATLEQIGDRVSVYGFNSLGRDRVRFLRVKDFDGRFDQGALRRLDALEPAGFTRLGAAIRHARHHVATQSGTTHRLLLVISDGLAYDTGYEGPYAEHDTRRALDEATAGGVGCVCLSVGTSIDGETRRRLWGNVTHLALSDADELSAQVVPMFQAALRAANAAGSRG